VDQRNVRTMSVRIANQLFSIAPFCLRVIPNGLQRLRVRAAYLPRSRLTSPEPHRSGPGKCEQLGVDEMAHGIPTVRVAARQLQLLLTGGALLQIRSSSFTQKRRRRQGRVEDHHAVGAVRHGPPDG